MYQSYEVITANVYCHIIPHDFISVLRLSEDQDSGGLLLLCMWGPPAQRRPRQNLCRHGAGHDWRHQVKQRHHWSLIQSYKLINCFSDVMRIFPHIYGFFTITDEDWWWIVEFGSKKSRNRNRGGIFIVPHTLWQGAPVFAVSSAGRPCEVYFDKHGALRMCA